MRPDAVPLRDGDGASQNRAVAHDDVSGEQRVVGDDGAVADVAVVTDVRAPHQQALVPDLRARLRTGRPVDLRVLAYVVAVADHQVRRERRRVLLVRARRAHHGVRAHFVAAAKHGGAGLGGAHHRVRPHHAARAERGRAEDMHARAQLAVGADDGVVGHHAERADARAGRDGGVLPDERTRVDPEQLAGRAGVREAHRAVRRGGKAPHGA